MCFTRNERKWLIFYACFFNSSKNSFITSSKGGFKILTVLKRCLCLIWFGKEQKSINKYLKINDVFKLRWYLVFSLSISYYNITNNKLYKQIGYNTQKTVNFNLYVNITFSFFLYIFKKTASHYFTLVYFFYYSYDIRYPIHLAHILRNFP